MPALGDNPHISDFTLTILQHEFSKPKNFCLHVHFCILIPGSHCQPAKTADNQIKFEAFHTALAGL